MNRFLTEKYDDIVLMSKKICKSNPEFEEVAHFAIEKFMLHERAQELVDANQAMQFISGIIYRSYYSSTSQYYTLLHQKGKVFGFPENHQIDSPIEDYNYERDMLTEAIQGILEEMATEGKEQWYRSCLFQMWLENQNYSEISRQVNIPRTSISKAVEECRQHIIKTLKERNLNYEL